MQEELETTVGGTVGDRQNSVTARTEKSLSLDQAELENRLHREFVLRQ